MEDKKIVKCGRCGTFVDKTKDRGKMIKVSKNKKRIYVCSECLTDINLNVLKELVKNGIDDFYFTIPEDRELVHTYDLYINYNSERVMSFKRNMVNIEIRRFDEETKIQQKEEGSKMMIIVKTLFMYSYKDRNGNTKEIKRMIYYGNNMWYYQMFMMYPFIAPKNTKEAYKYIPKIPRDIIKEIETS